MTMNPYVEEWFHNLLERHSSHAIKARVESWGELHKHVGPRTLFARVRIALSPHDRLEIIDSLPAEKRAWLDQAESFDPITFGVLDVVLVGLNQPLNTFKLEILDVEYSEVDSSPVAFRLAAREAARQILSESRNHSL